MNAIKVDASERSRVEASFPRYSYTLDTLHQSTARYSSSAFSSSSLPSSRSTSVGYKTNWDIQYGKLNGPQVKAQNRSELTTQSLSYLLQESTARESAMTQAKLLKLRD